MDSQNAILINQFIDRIHNPNYWILFWIIALFILLEYTIFPKREILIQTRYQKIILYFKFSILILTFVIAFSQSVFGGCVIQLFQNYLAINYLDREYWYPYGLVFREKFDPKYWIYLRLTYIFLTILYGIWIYKYATFVSNKIKKAIKQR